MSKNTDWRLGFGIIHHSNGHTKLPNQGLNSLAMSFSAKIHRENNSDFTYEKPSFESKSQVYFSVKTGVGQNVLSDKFNHKKEVYDFSIATGKIINNTFKFGGGFYYRFYEHYYDYIKSNGAIIDEDFPIFKDNPVGYASNFGFFATSELLMSHIGFEFRFGVNIYKPFYKVDWQLSQGYYYEDNNGNFVYVTGELNWYYKVKQTVSGRLGLKYYLWPTNKVPKHNLYIGTHINTNLGQADFTELSLGYVHRFKLKKKNHSNTSNQKL